NVQQHPIERETLAALPCQPHNISYAVQTLIVCSEHCHDNIGQLNSADSTGICQASSAVDQNNIILSLPLGTEALKKVAAAFTKKFVPVEALEIAGIIRIGFVPARKNIK